MHERVSKLSKLQGLKSSNNFISGFWILSKINVVCGNCIVTWLRLWSIILRYTKLDVPCGTDNQRTKHFIYFFKSAELGYVKKRQHWTFNVNFPKHDLLPILSCRTRNSTTQKSLRIRNRAQLAFLMVATRKRNRNFIKF